LDAHVVGPVRWFGVEDAVDGERLVVDEDGIEAVLRRRDALGVPLEVMPRAAGEARARDAGVHPLVIRAIPNVPLVGAEDALRSHHQLLPADGLPQVVLGGPDARGGRGVEVDVEVPEEMRSLVLRADFVDPERARPRRTSDEELTTAAAERWRGEERSRGVSAGNGSAGAVGAVRPRVGGVLDGVEDGCCGGNRWK